MTKRVRVLHVVGRMNRGGVETWLLQVARAMVGVDVQFDFLVHNPEPGAYDPELRSLGCRIIPCPMGGRPLSYLRRLSRILAEAGPFDVVHSHVHHFSGIVLAVAKRQGVRVRIAHSHTAPGNTDASALRRLYLAGTEFLVRRRATIGLSASALAAESLFGKRWKDDRRWRIQYCSIDVERYVARASRPSVRAELGIEPDCVVMGHVGRFTVAKNHEFLVSVFAELKTLRSDAQLLLVGDGELLPVIQRLVASQGLADSVRFLGSRGDVAELMASAIDVLVMPSLHEGLPLVALEAQATGLPMVLADTITPELEIIPQLIRRHSLREDPSVWASTVLQLARAGHHPQGDAIDRMLASPFSMTTGIAALRRVYGLSPR